MKKNNAPITSFEDQGPDLARFSLDLVEARGCELVLQEWIALSKGDLLNLYDTNTVLADFLRSLS